MTQGPCLKQNLTIIKFRKENWMNTHLNMSARTLIRKCPLLVILTLAIYFLGFGQKLALADGMDMDPDIIEQIAENFHAKASQWESTLQKHALNLFYILLVFDICWLGIKGVLNRPSLPELFGRFSLLVLTAGFFLAVIQYYPEWTKQIMRGFESIAHELEPGVEPKSPLWTAFNLMAAFVDAVGEISFTEFGMILPLALVALIILVVFALMTAQIIFVKCETYIAMAAAIILLGLGGSSLFRDYAVNTLRYAFSVCFKLFVMMLLLAMGMAFLRQFEIQAAQDPVDLLVNMFIICASTIVLFALIRTIPECCASIINGSHTGSGSQITSALGTAALVGATVATGGFGAAAAGAKGLANVKAASSLAGAQGSGGVIGTARVLGGAISRSAQTGQSVSNIIRSQHEALRQDSNL